MPCGSPPTVWVGTPRSCRAGCEEPLIHRHRALEAAENAAADVVVMLDGLRNVPLAEEIARDRRVGDARRHAIVREEHAPAERDEATLADFERSVRRWRVVHRQRASDA